MRNLLKKNDTKKYRNRIVFMGSLGMLVILALLLAACGGATTTGNSAVQTSAPAPQSGSSSSHDANSSSGQSTKSTSSFGPQYLIKSLQVNMLVKDTRQVASDLQSWIATTDPRSTSAGINYEQTYDNFYNVTMTFSVTSAQYTQIEEYLAGYAQQHGGKLTSLHESVQDVSNDYIDSQSRLTNLRGEQQRLLTLLSNSTALGDIITVESKLTDVEGQIEDIEAHLNALKNQTTFYMVTIGLQPIAPVTPPPPPSTPWSLGQVLHDAWSTALGFGQGLATLLIWLVVFCIYLIPVALVGWFIWRRIHLRQAVTSPVTTTGSSQTGP
jgi:opacity protein-like surface antigen